MGILRDIFGPPYTKEEKLERIEGLKRYLNTPCSTSQVVYEEAELELHKLEMEVEGEDL